jgi:glycosyltransferase 2 family protein
VKKAGFTKTALKFLLKLALTAACLWWAFSQVKFDFSIFAKPGMIDYRWLIAGAAMAGISIVFQGLRWWFFLRGLGLPVSAGRAIELTMIDGLFSLASVSGFGGDAARILLLIRDHPGKKLPIAMAVMADHLAGLVSLALLFFMISVAKFEVLAQQSMLGRGVIQFAWFYLGGGLAMVGLMFVCASPPVHRLIHGNDRFRRFPIMKKIPEIYDVYRRNWRFVLAGVAVSFLMLGAYFTSYFCGMRAVGGTADYSAVISAMPVIDAISGLPISVAGMGVREKLFEVLMKDLAGITPTTAVAASLAGFACNAFWAIFGALFFLKKRDRLGVIELQASEAE